MREVKNVIFFTLVLICFTAFNRTPKTVFSPKYDPISGIASVIMLKDGGNVIDLNRDIQVKNESYIIFNQSDKIKDVFISKSLIENISDYQKCFDSDIIEQNKGIQIKLKPISCETLIKNNR